MNTSIQPIGCILAGGLSTRMQGSEKTLLDLGDRPMIWRIAERLGQQVRLCILNANGDARRFEELGLPVQPDLIEGFAGPLAGVHAGMVWARQNASEATHLLTVAGDTPFFPDDLRTRLEAEAAKPSVDGKPAIALAYSDGNRHPTFGLWPLSLLEELETFLLAGDRKVMLFAQQYVLRKVEFELTAHDGKPLDPFFNINTPEDFAIAKSILEARSR